MSGVRPQGSARHKASATAPKRNAGNPPSVGIPAQWVTSPVGVHAKASRTATRNKARPRRQLSTRAVTVTTAYKIQLAAAAIRLMREGGAKG